MNSSRERRSPLRRRIDSPRTRSTGSAGRSSPAGDATISGGSPPGEQSQRRQSLTGDLLGRRDPVEGRRVSGREEPEPRGASPERGVRAQRLGVAADQHAQDARSPRAPTRPAARRLRPALRRRGRARGRAAGAGPRRGVEPRAQRGLLSRQRHGCTHSSRCPGRRAPAPSPPTAARGSTAASFSRSSGVKRSRT